jgi:hypothetical protein
MEKASGKVTFTLLETICNITPTGVSDRQRNINVTVPSISFQFHFRVLNTYPIPKSISVHSVKVYPHKPRWWNRISPLPLRVHHTEVGKVFNEQEMNSDVQCNAHSFMRLWISGHAIPESVNLDEIRPMMGTCGGIRLRLLISPRKLVSIWYPLQQQSIQTTVANWNPKTPMF